MLESYDESKKGKTIKTVKFAVWGGNGFSNILINIPLTAETTSTESTSSSTPAEETTTTVALDAIKAGDNYLIIPNDTVGNKASVSVSKTWGDDTYFKELRPDSITVTLYRLKSENGNYVEDNDFTEITKEIKPADVTVDADWKCKFDDLDTKDDDNNPYKYYVVETVVSDKYTFTKSAEAVSGDRNLSNAVEAGNNITITNTLKTTEITATKYWVDSTGASITKNELLPASVDVKLQYKDGTEWKDVPDSVKTLTPSTTPEENWTCTYNKLPANYEYQVVEVNCPDGWTQILSTPTTSTNKTTTVTNKQLVGSLKIEKSWYDKSYTFENDDCVTIAVYRSEYDSPVTMQIYNTNMDSKTTYDLEQDYSRLLQYSLYFYDANMCGSDVYETSAYSWRGNCHTVGDTYSITVDGGYHDAGDHVMFGLPQGFTASTLGWEYYEFKDSFDSLGLTDHYQTIMKRFCDFFSNCIKTESGTTKILVQKGENGDNDHNYWGSPEKQTSKTYSGEIWVTGKGGDIAAEYAAALAAYAVNFPENPESERYLEKAEAFYNFAINNTDDYDESNTFYDSGKSTDDIAWAAGWLYLATKKDSYKTKLESYNDIDWLYNWNNVDFGVACLKAEISNNWSSVNNKINSEFVNATKIADNYICLNDWGSARYSTLMQFVALVSAKHSGDDANYKDLCKEQMSYLLGNNNKSDNNNNNNSSTCFVTGFADNSASHAHHRAASVSKESYAHTLIGALVGGPNTKNSYTDSITDHKCNEVALDYNAGLVGAAAALYSTYKKDETVSKNFTLDDLSDKGRLSSAVKTDMYKINIVSSAESASIPVAELTEAGPNILNLNIGTYSLAVAGDENDYEWSIVPEEDGTTTDIARIDSTDKNLLILSENIGTFEVSNGKTTYTITVKDLPVVPDVSNCTIVGTYDIQKKDNWKFTVDKLPLYSPTGKKYVYYIKEIDNNDTTEDNYIKVGSGTYYPVSYTGNGVILADKPNYTAGVSVKNKKTDNITMPSSGGSGTTGYYVFGMIIVCTAGTLLLVKRKRTAK